MTRSETVLRTVLTSATMLAVLVAWVVVVVGLSGIWGLPMAGGCGGGTAILLLMAGGITLVGFGLLLMITLVAIVGLVFLWVRYHIGAGFAFAANVLALLTLGVVTTDPSVLGLWKIVVAVLAPSPVVAVAVILWVWASRVPTREGKVIVPIVAVIVLSPVAALYGFGLVRDVNAVVAAPPVTAVQLTGSCGPSGSESWPARNGPGKVGREGVSGP